MGYPLAQIETVKAQLSELPVANVQTRDVSKQEAIKLLARDITGLQRKGYSLDQVAALLSERGIPINTGTLKSYMRRTKRKRSRDGAKAKPSTAKAAADTRAETPPEVGATSAKVPSSQEAKPGKNTFAPRHDSEDI